MQLRNKILKMQHPADIELKTITEIKTSRNKLSSKDQHPDKVIQRKLPRIALVQSSILNNEFVKTLWGRKGTLIMMDDERDIQYSVQSLFRLPITD